MDFTYNACFIRFGQRNMCNFAYNVFGWICTSFDILSGNHIPDIASISLSYFHAMG